MELPTLATDRFRLAALAPRDAARVAELGERIDAGEGPWTS